MSPTQVISTNGIGPNCRRRRESLVFVVVVVIGNGAIEDENEDEDDLIAALPRFEIFRLMPPQNKPMIHAFGLVVFQRRQVSERG